MRKRQAKKLLKNLPGNTKNWQSRHWRACRKFGYLAGVLPDQTFVYLTRPCRPPVVNLKDFALRKGLARYAKRAVRPEFYGTVTIANLT